MNREVNRLRAKHKPIDLPISVFQFVHVEFVSLNYKTRFSIKISVLFYSSGETKMSKGERNTCMSPILHE